MQENKRDDLPPLEQAVSDVLDEYLWRLHGIVSSWSHPREFIQWLNERGYIIHAKDQGTIETAE